MFKCFQFKFPNPNGLQIKICAAVYKLVHLQRLLQQRAALLNFGAQCYFVLLKTSQMLEK